MYLPLTVYRVIHVTIISRHTWRPDLSEMVLILLGGIWRGVIIIGHLIAFPIECNRSGLINYIIRSKG